MKQCAELLASGGSWNLGLTRRLYQNQIEEVCSLLALIENKLVGTGEDVLSWSFNKKGLFSVKLAYSWLEKKMRFCCLILVYGQDLVRIRQDSSYGSSIINKWQQWIRYT